MNNPRAAFDAIKNAIPADCIAINIYHRASTYHHETTFGFHSDSFIAAAAFSDAHLKCDCIWQAQFSRDTPADPWREDYTEIKEPPRVR